MTIHWVWKYYPPPRSSVYTHLATEFETTSTLVLPVGALFGAQAQRLMRRSCENSPTKFLLESSSPSRTTPTMTLVSVRKGLPTDARIYFFPEIGLQAAYSSLATDDVYQSVGHLGTFRHDLGGYAAPVGVALISPIGSTYTTADAKRIN